MKGYYNKMILDFVFICTFFSSVVRGFVKGFSQTFVSLIAFTIAIVIVVSVNGWVGDLIVQSPVGIMMQEAISDSIIEKIEKQKESMVETSALIESFFEPASDKEEAFDVSFIADTIAKKTLKGLVDIFLIIFTTLSFGIVVKLIKKIFKTAASLPVISTFDRFLGGFCGIVSGIIILFLLIALVMLLQLIPGLSYIRSQFDNSIILMVISDFVF